MKRKRLRALDLLVYVGARAALAVTTWLPERCAYGLAGALGRGFFRLSRRRQRHALHQLRNAYGTSRSDAELLRLARCATGHLFQVALDMVRIGPLLARGDLLRCITNPEIVQQVPRGPALIVSGHLGSWEVAGLVIAASGQACHAIGRRFRNPYFDRFVFGQRERGGLFVHPRRGGVRALARAMRGGALGLQVVDQNQRLRGVAAPWFGELASCERAAATLAMRLQCPIHVGATYREGNGLRFSCVLGAAIRPQPLVRGEAEVRRLVTAINAELEKLVLARPEQYLWIHDRYRTRPHLAAVDPGTEDDETEAETEA